MASKFGLSSQGFTIKRFTDIYSDIFASLRTNIGNITNAPKSILGIIITIFSNAMADLWEMADGTLNEYFPRTATGVNQDYAVERLGMQRKSATQSTVMALITGIDGTVLTAGFQASTKTTKFLFQTTDNFTVSASDCLNAVCSVDSVSVGASYQVLVGGSIVATTTGVLGDTIIAIAGRLLAAFSSTDNTLTDNGDGTLNFTAGGVPVSFAVGVDMSISQVSSLVKMTAIKYGALLCPQGMLNTIATPISGIFSITNPQDGAVGLDTESDDALRVRYFASLRLPGKSTVDGMRSYLLQNIPNVSQVFVHENVSSGVDYVGNPPNTIAVIVVGGVSQDIVDAIWTCKAAGIGTWGDSHGTVIDASGDSHLIWYSQQSTKYLWLVVQIVLYTEEPLPNDYIQQIYNGISAVVATQSLGKDVILQRYCAAINDIAGIGSCQVWGALTDVTAPAPIYPTDYTSSVIDTGAHLWGTIPVAANYVVAMPNLTTGMVQILTPINPN